MGAHKSKENPPRGVFFEAGELIDLPTVVNARTALPAALVGRGI
jgi:hypothetical protein